MAVHRPRGGVQLETQDWARVRTPPPRPRVLGPGHPSGLRGMYTPPARRVPETDHAHLFFPAVGVLRSSRPQHRPWWWRLRVLCSPHPPVPGLGEDPSPPAEGGADHQFGDLTACAAGCAFQAGACDRRGSHSSEPGDLSPLPSVVPSKPSICLPLQSCWGRGGGGQGVAVGEGEEGGGWLGWGGWCYAKSIRAREGASWKRAQTEERVRKKAKEGKGKEEKKEGKRKGKESRESARAERVERPRPRRLGSALRSVGESAPAFAGGRRRGALWK